MRTIAVHQLRSNASKPVLTTLLEGEDEVTVMSGRGKNKEPIAVIMSYTRYVQIAIQLSKFKEMIDGRHDG